MRWFIFRKLVITNEQYNRISNIFDGAGQVIFGVAVVTPVIRGLDNFDARVLLLALIVALFCWVISIRLARKG